MGSKRMDSALRALLAAVAAASVLVACGVGSGGTGASFTSGSITGFGSVIVGGVRYDDSSARVEDDEGAERSATDLRLGMVADIDATGDYGGKAVAQSIRFRSELIGPVTAINTATPSITVLGQRVAVLATTVFDSASLPGGLAALAVGDVVEVYGQLDLATTRITASRVERRGSVGAYKLRGPIATLDTKTKTLVVGGQTIGYAQAPPDATLLLAVGQFVRVTLRTTPIAGVWTATSLRSGALRLEDLQQVTIEGRISAYTSSAHFSVNGVPVDASGVSYGGGSSRVVLGAHVTVKGSSSGGTLVARSVDVADEESPGSEYFDLSGSITAVDLAAKTFVVRGVTVSYTNTTRFEGGGPANLVVGRKVQAKGLLSSDRTRLEAVSIEFDE